MMLAEVIKGIDTLQVEGDCGSDISGISYDSRKTRPGDLFVAMSGGRTDGHAFIPQAVSGGASAVIYENDAAVRSEAAGLHPSAVAFIQVKDSREALALAANNYYSSPSKRLQLIGVTGTNGKTTTAYLIKSVLEKSGKKVGLIGTIEYMIGEKSFASSFTTPEAPEFQQMLADMADAGCSHAVSEVSSHALAQQRVDGSVFQTVVFTNLTRDHLDFHETMEEYFVAKERLFTKHLGDEGFSVINHDDEYGRRLFQDAGRGLSYGLSEGADIVASGVLNTSEGLCFNVTFEGAIHQVKSLLIGTHNVYNIMAAFGAGIAAGVPVSGILEGIRSCGAVRGRFERVDEGQPFVAVIDFAHTDDALERTILAARELTDGRIITVFGCGGDRDKGKRPRMGGVATRLSDYVILTSDNPRSEAPEAIIRDIEAGAVRSNFISEPDRRRAIMLGVKEARSGDLLLIAGKGHEEYQEIGGNKISYSDRAVLSETIRQAAGKI